MLGIAAALLLGAAATTWYVVGDADGRDTDASPVAVERPFKPTATAAAGQPVTDGALQYVINSIECGRSTTGDGGPTAEGQFCLVTVEATNVGSEPRTFDASYQWAVDGAGERHPADTTASLYANQNGETFLRDLVPGAEVSGVLVFDVPEGQTIVSVELHESPDSTGAAVAAR
ncbi:DUF4352 domain-containing protein [Cryptosporangium sp. NPDC048952]|uniref:DUF4352 domain-containing protein n=1 Tax=Cryptosporangium sp. NPDC048952 TaxID=3363961 RepID=UPI003710953A